MHELDFDFFRKITDGIMPIGRLAQFVDVKMIGGRLEFQRFGDVFTEIRDQIQITFGIQKQPDKRRLILNFQLLINMRPPAVV